MDSHPGQSLAAVERHRRRRTALSCVQCRHRKIKCDRKDPCSHCVASKRECVYVGPKPRAPSSTPERMSGSVSVFAPASAPALAAGTSSSTGPPKPYTWPDFLRHRPRQDVPDSLHSFEAQLQKLSERLEKVEDQSESEKADNNDNNSSNNSNDNQQKDGPSNANFLGWEDSRVFLNKSRLVGSSNSLTMTDEIPETWACFSECYGVNDGIHYQTPKARQLIAQMTANLQKCKAIARSLKADRPPRCFQPLQQEHQQTSLALPVGLPLPSREVADAMAALYWQHFESSMRILHRPTFDTDYERFWLDPHSAPVAIRFQVMLVISIGAAVDISLEEEEEEDDNVNNNSKKTKNTAAASAANSNWNFHGRPWTYAAQAWLSGPVEKDRLNIPGIQVFCLVLLARQILSIGGDLIWASAGTLVHCAMQIGLHRDPRQLTGAAATSQAKTKQGNSNNNIMTTLQAEMRRRLWATVVELQVQAALDAGMPPRIYWDECDAQPPANLNDEDLDERLDRTVSNSADLESNTTFTHSTIQRLLLASLRVRVRVLKLLNGLSTSLSYMEVLALTDRLLDHLRIGERQCLHSAASAASAASAGSAGSTGGPVATSFCRHMLAFLVRRFLPPLHAPFLGRRARSNRLFCYSAQVGRDASLAILAAATEPRCSDLAFRHLFVTGGGMFREGVRFAGMIVGLERMHEVREQYEQQLQPQQILLSDLSLAENRETPAQRALRQMRILSLERIRRGETNMKSYAFVHMLEVQAAAQAAGRACDEEAIVTSARDSFAECVGILEELQRKQKEEMIMSQQQTQILQSHQMQQAQTQQQQPLQQLPNSMAGWFNDDRGIMALLDGETPDSWDWSAQLGSTGQETWFAWKWK